MGAKRRRAATESNPVDGIAEYDLRRLVGHLAEVGRSSDLHRLLALETSRGRNAWYARKESLGDVAGYAADIAVARDLSITEALGTLQGPSPSIGVPLRYTLIEATLASLAQTVNPTLAQLAVADGVWPLEQAIAYARAMPDPLQRAQTLVSGARTKLEADRAPLLEDALASAWNSTSLSLPWFLKSLAEALPEPLVRRLLDQLPADERRSGTPSEWFKWAHVRAACAIRLGKLGLVDDALDLALALPVGLEGDRPRADALCGLGPCLTEPLLERALATSEDLGDVDALASLIPHLARVNRWEEAVRRASALPEKELLSPPHRARSLASIAQFAPRVSRHRVISLAVEAARRFGDERGELSAIDAFAAFLPALNAAERKRALAEALRRVGDQARAGGVQASVQNLLRLAKAVPERDRRRVLDEAVSQARDPAGFGMSAHAWDTFIAEMLIGIWPGTAPAQGLALAREVKDASKHRHALLTLAERLKPSDRRAVLAELIDDARRVRDAGRRALVLLELLQYLPPKQQASCRSQVRKLIPSITSASERCAVCQRLASKLPESERVNLLSEALDATADGPTHHSSAELIEGLARDLPVELLPKARILAGRLGQEEFRARALIALVPRANRSLTAALARAALQAVEGISDAKAQARVLERLVPLLPARRVRDAIAIATAIADALPRAMALAVLLSAAEEGESLAEALLSAIREALRPPARGRPLRFLRHLQPVRDFATRQRLDAMVAPHLLAHGRLKPLDKLNALLGCAAKLPSRHRRAALRILVRHASKFRDEEKVQALCCVSAYLEPRSQRRALDDALATAQATEDLLAKAFSLAHLSRYLQDPECARIVQVAIETVSQLEDPSFRAQVLAILAPRVSAPLVKSFLAEAGRIDSESFRAGLLVGLVRSLDGLQGDALLAFARGIHDPEARALALTAVHLSIPGEAGTHVIEEGLTALQRVRDPTVILDLLEALQQELLARSPTLRGRALFDAIAKLAGLPRERCLEHSVRLTVLLHAHGGSPAIEAFASAVGDTGRWWP